MLEWQWSERVVPYWKDTAKCCKQPGVRVAIEMHPNFVAYNPETMLRLRDVAPGTIGCNFDPSHMFWQQVDRVAAIRALGDSHLPRPRQGLPRSTARTPRSTACSTCKKYTDELDRSWIFRTVGYGNDAIVWKDIVSTLRMVGYDHVHQHRARRQPDVRREGLKKAIELLKNVVISAPAGKAYWA